MHKKYRRPVCHNANFPPTLMCVISMNHKAPPLPYVNGLRDTWREISAALRLSKSLRSRCYGCSEWAEIHTFIQRQLFLKCAENLRIVCCATSTSDNSLTDWLIDRKRGVCRCWSFSCSSRLAFPERLHSICETWGFVCGGHARKWSRAVHKPKLKKFRVTRKI